jgi:hypothetical protein
MSFIIVYRIDGGALQVVQEDDGDPIEYPDVASADAYFENS